MSRCSYVETRLRALVDGELGAGERARVLAHLEDCPACRGAYARVQAVTSLLQEQEPEDVPPHFGANLHVRLARYRQERQAARRRFAWLRALRAPFGGSPRRKVWSVVGGVGSLAVCAALGVMFLPRSIGAAEVARRAEQSWQRIRNYGCTFESTGVYRGQDRTFRQRQFFRKNGINREFRLDTEQDYPLTTFVYSDRVVHYIQGGDWEGHGPLVITWPRKEGRNVLPFPFGVAWQSGGNVSLDQLIRQLNENRDARLVAEEPVGGFPCYRLAFTAVPPGGSQPDEYEVWVDKESFLPRRVSWYRDEDNHIVTEAKSLQVNYEVLPAGTFDFRAPEGAFFVNGDMDPHVLALPFAAAEQANFEGDPVETTAAQTWRRSRSVLFPVRTPGTLPDGFRLVRVRSKSGYWVDMYWMRVPEKGPARVLKLIEQDGRTEPTPEFADARPVDLGRGGRHIRALVVEGAGPYPYLSVTWRDGKTRYTLFGAGIDLAAVRQMAASMRRPAPPAPRIASGARRRWPIENHGEASDLPVETDATASAEAPAAAPADPPVVSEQPPMMPDMPDPEHVAAR